VPLRALQNGTNTFAFEQDEVSWTILKTNYKSSSLLMPCCQSAAIPKTSRLGNFFFAHSIQGDCHSEPESQEHIWVKSLVAKAAKKAGWDVKTEWPGESKDAEKWIADVYCTKGAIKIVIEIQLSRQTVEETHARQLKYKNSGVRCAWLASELTFKNQFIMPCKDLPFFIMSSPKVGFEPTLIDFSTSLSDFIIGMFNKKLNWVIEESAEEYAIDYIEDTCWNCKKENKQVYGYSIDVYGSHAVTNF
jgi:competence CoiA-like predicted nuclease